MFCEPFLSVMGAGIMSFSILTWMLQQRQNNEDFHRKAAFSFLLSAGLQFVRSSQQTVLLHGACRHSGPFSTVVALSPWSRPHPLG